MKNSLQEYKKHTNLKFWESFGLVDNEGVLLNEIRLFLFFGLSRLVLLLDVLDQPESSVQVGAGGAQLAGFLDVCTSESPNNEKITTH